MIVYVVQTAVRLISTLVLLPDRAKPLSRVYEGASQSDRGVSLNVRLTFRLRVRLRFRLRFRLGVKLGFRLGVMLG